MSMSRVSLSEYTSMSRDLEYIRPLEKCCSSSLEVFQVEPLEGRNTLEVNCTCIVKCPDCGRQYMSKWDEMGDIDNADYLGQIVSDKELTGGRYVYGYWDGKDVQDLLRILGNIENKYPYAVIDYDNLPFNSRVPDGVTEYPAWTMDENNICLAGDSAKSIRSLIAIKEEQSHFE